MSFGDALVRKMGLSAQEQLSLWQIFLLRSGLILPVLLALALRFGGVRPSLWIVLRSGMLVLMWLLYYAALQHMPLAVGAAAYYTLPLFILLFSALLTKDRIGPLGVIAVVLGFIGVLVITRPDANGANPWLILPLSAAVLYALSMILTRTRCAGDSVVGLALWLNIVFVIVGAVGVLALPNGAPMDLWQSKWVPMNGQAWGMMAISSLAILIGGLGTAFAYQRGPAPLLGSFDFSYLAFAIIWGWVMFDERADTQTVIGMALIVLAGLLAIHSSNGASGPARSSEA
nr:DMT family transporter [Octadecabacter sp. B2R22]